MPKRKADESQVANGAAEAMETTKTNKAVKVAEITKSNNEDEMDNADLADTEQDSKGVGSMDKESILRIEKSSQEDAGEYFGGSDQATEDIADTLDNIDNNVYEQTGQSASKTSTSSSSRLSQRKQKTSQQTSDSILTLEVGADVETQRDKEDAVLHEIRHSRINGSLLTGILGKVEHLGDSGVISVVDYKGYRIIIPMKEMELDLKRPDGQSDDEFNERSLRVLNSMMGAEIDFVVRDIKNDNDGLAIVASRKTAMFRLRRRYYLTNGANGKPQVHTGRIVEARIVAVSQLSIRVEVFGVETPIRNKELSWNHIGDARDKYFVGDSVQVRIRGVQGDTIETLRVKADIKSLTENTNYEKLLALKPQTNCIGKVTDVVKGVVYINLVDGVRAISHKCFDRRRPARGDDVLFVCTRVDKENGFAIGIISRIIKRNI